MLDLHITATDTASLQAKILDLAGASGLSAFASEALLGELRQRMAVDGQVVRVVKFDDETETNTADAER
jgi:hypothetical protein